MISGSKYLFLQCDGQTPSCRNCIRLGRGRCFPGYALVISVIRLTLTLNISDCLVEDPATGQHRPRNYMQSLEARVALLEGLLQEVRPDVAIDHFTMSSSTMHPPDYRDTSVMSHRDTDVIGPDRSSDFVTIGDLNETSPDHVGDDADDLASEVALLCLNASGREPHYFGPSSGLSFSRAISSALRIGKVPELNSQGRSGIPNANTEARRKFLHPLLPSQTAGSVLSQTYFDNIHPQYPFLHRPTFEAWESECMKSFHTGSTERSSNASLFFVLMVLYLSVARHLGILSVSGICNWLPSR